MVLAVAAFVASVRSLPAAQKDAQLAALVVALANSGSPATQAIVARPGGVPAGRFRPPVYITIWNAVEASADTVWR